MLDNPPEAGADGGEQVIESQVRDHGVVDFEQQTDAVPFARQLRLSRTGRCAGVVERDPETARRHHGAKQWTQTPPAGVATGRVHAPTRAIARAAVRKPRSPNDRPRRNHAQIMSSKMKKTEE